MNLVKIFIRLLVLCHWKTQNFALFNQNTNIQSVSKAISDVMQEFHNSDQIKFDFFIYGNTTNHINDIIDEVIKNFNGKISYRIPSTMDWNHFFIQSAIIFTSSIENLIHFHQKQFSSQSIINRSYKPLKFLFYCEELKSLQNLTDILEVSADQFDLRYPDVKFFEFFILNENTKILLIGNLLFSIKSCGKFKLKVLNFFDKFTKSWNEKLQNYDHFENFFGCLLPFSNPLNLNSFYFEEMRELVGKNINRRALALMISRNEVKYQGLIHEVIQSMALIANFTTHYRVFDDKYFYTQNNFNFNTSLIISEQKLASIEGRGYYNTFWSVPFSSLGFYYTVTPNDLYTNYEKIFMPFDQVTWSLLIFTFGLTFGIIFLINMYYKWLRTIVCGEGVKKPAYNALGIFFGVSQTRLPRHYFSRLILLLFIWFCLIIRTCYQSVMFEFMTSNMRKPLPQSIDDLIKWNYTIVINEENFYADVINQQIIGENSVVNIYECNTEKFYELYKDALNGKTTKKFAFFTSHTLHVKFSSDSKISLPVMENVKFSTIAVLQMCNNDILFKHLDYVMQNFVSNGIAKHLVDYALWFLARPYDVEVEDPRRILSMKDLEFGFVIWLFACCLAILVFVYEISNFIFGRRFENRLKNVFGNIAFLKILNEMLNNYHDN